MKKLVLPIMLVAIVVGLYEQTKDKPNIYILIITIIAFMYGMMQLSAKTLHHNNHDIEEEENIEKEEDVK
ncbi:MAG: hypothetical protein ACOYLT_04655 [Flavobacterium sp.]|jgi:hypothetical protein|uniref:hypothetical protein n=1 Tax=Flavobacterium sp. TaxID=239 RepID=UPI003BBE6464